MSEGLTVQVPDKLQQFINKQVGPDGLYESADEYMRDLIRRDYQQHESRKWSMLADQLRPGMYARESDFVDFNPEEIIKTAKKEKTGNVS